MTMKVAVGLREIGPGIGIRGYMEIISSVWKDRETETHREREMSPSFSTDLIPLGGVGCEPDTATCAAVLIVDVVLRCSGRRSRCSPRMRRAAGATAACLGCTTPQLTSDAPRRRSSSQLASHGPSSKPLASDALRCRAIAACHAAGAATLGSHVPRRQDAAARLAQHAVFCCELVDRLGDKVGLVGGNW
ncbi:unnamed protein product [Miscanthus lutarioriparius]|uniref:Uncharacterized protein n=1 Tax=Miscanthus lutarioriparius TaxID=422564 RepID=A0A811NJH1_9POAL|nr:unnamed protein product [Miscanthus lutarioriparius]